MTMQARFVDGALSFVDVETGEAFAALDLLGDVEQVARAAAAAREASEILVAAERSLTDQLEYFARTKKVASRTPIAGTIPERTMRRKWDAKRVRDVLARCVAAGRITPEEMDAAAPLVPQCKPDGRLLNAILTDLSGTELGLDLRSLRDERVSWKVEFVRDEVPS